MPNRVYSYLVVSPLAQGRGLKLRAYVVCRDGLWSPLAQGRGLKPLFKVLQDLEQRVAPRTGAWIETCCQFLSGRVGRVAPRTGAWIETIRNCSVSFWMWSPLAQGRGLKQ